MSYNYKFKQKRSFFYLTSFENDENITVFVNKKVLQKGVKKVSTFNTQ